MLANLLPAFGYDRQGFFRNIPVMNYPKREGRLSCLVTGGSKGIGQSIVMSLATLGHEVSYTGRDVNPGVHLFCELSEPQSVLNLVSQITIPLDVLVLNAGAMPNSLSRNSLMEEVTFASQIKGHLLLLESLVAKNMLNPDSRVIWVSSAGMLFKRLDLNLFRMDRQSHYQKHTVYANVKRAQVILAQMLSAPLKEQGVLCASMHPGWVQTSGVESSMPVFNWLYSDRLRSPDQGADTILWMALSQEGFSPGQFYFDRKCAPMHGLPHTRESLKERQELLQLSRYSAHS